MGQVLGILGATLPPLASGKHVKHARDSFITDLYRMISELGSDAVDYALVTMDQDTGPWTCNLLRRYKIPYIAVEAEGQPFTQKLRHWRNKAVDRILVPVPEKIQSGIMEAAQAGVLVESGTEQLMHRSQRAVKRRLSYLIRNIWTIQHSDSIFHCCLPNPDGKTTGIRFYLFKDVLTEKMSTEGATVHLWTDAQVARLLQDSHDKRKRQQQRKRGKKPFMAIPENEVPF